MVMLLEKTPLLFQRMDQWEMRLCLWCNQADRPRWGHGLFAAASRLGNGVIWYVLLVAIALFDPVSGIGAASHLFVVGVMGIAIYKLLKKKLVRQRPYMTWDTIRLGAAPLDLYSFPSGHTLHAVSATWVVTAYYPDLAWALVPFAVLVALSRVVLGLHYPTDVLVGALIGAALAVVSFYWFPLP